MKLLGCFIALLMLSVAKPHPVHMICMPSCNMDITASEEYIWEWLNNSNDVGIQQLRNSMDMGTIINVLIRNSSTSVS